MTDGNLWIEQRRFLLRHLRNLGFGKNDMATMIEEEASHLVNSLLKRLETNSIIRKNSVNGNSVKNDGRIYRLTKQENVWKNKISSGNLEDREIFETGCKIVNGPKSLKIEDMYVKAEDYDEVRKASKFSEIVIQMDDTFGVPILNTIWRMIAGKRFVKK